MYYKGMGRKVAWFTVLMVAFVGGWMLMRGAGRVETTSALLVGRWAETHSDGTTIHWEFSPNGSFSRTINAGDGKSTTGKWSVNSNFLALAFDSETQGLAAGGAKLVLSLESSSRGQIGTKGMMSPIRRL